MKPTLEELTSAVKKLKNSKAGGSSNILPEMVKAACEEVRKVPQEWTDATIIPIPKKGNLNICDNWRGIALLEVVGKVVARVIQARLQKVAEEELPESQCGFREGRGCSDMIFTVRQLVEKTIEHHSKQFLIFVDLTKAYDTVPREALWCALQKLGVPKTIIDIIQSLHEGMKARVWVEGELLEEIDVDNGLRQGCTLAPVLFNIYACLVVERGLHRLQTWKELGCTCASSMTRSCSEGTQEMRRKHE